MHGSIRRIWITSLALLASPTLAIAAKPDVSIANERPDPATIQRFGPAYRYPRAGWIVLHIEGAPYERGYQHGRLLFREIADYVTTLATKRSAKDPAAAWRETRTMVNALFLRRYDKEYLEEMKGIADGATAAGATFQGRPLDFLDIVTLNSDIELEFLDSALDATSTGLEARTYREPPDLCPTPAPPEHCSAFAATGPATADGKIVFGHITMFSLYFVRHFNVWLDVKPENGHRVLMQTYAGGIQSGMDYYLNDAGLIVAETTIQQTKFDVNGMTLASRIRKALQYADTIDKAVEYLRDGNNGMYTNEWLLADTKTNEIAMFELGTHKSKLWRSSKDEWFSGTKGFYWGCNNAKDLNVRLESVASVEGRPANVVYHPADRDITWLKLYEKHKGKIGTAFGFEAFTTPPLSAFSSCDAKFTTTDLAKDLKTWALFGPPLGQTWDPSEADRARFAEVQPLISNDWTILSAEPPASSSKTTTATTVDLTSDQTNPSSESPDLPHPPAWHGTILPKSDADIWLAAAFSDYEKIVAKELAIKAKVKTKAKGRALNAEETDDLAVSMFAPYTHYKTAVTRLGRDVPLAKTESQFNSDEWYQIASGKGVLLLAALRERLGDESFFKLMNDFGRANAGKTVTTDLFRTAVIANHPELSAYLDTFFNTWLNEAGLPGKPRGGFWSIDSFEKELDQSVIVYGTLKESDAQREAAEHLQRQIQRKWSNITVPILADTVATPEALKGRHVLIVGRPDTNSVAPGFISGLPVTFGPASFVIRGATYGHARTALIAAGPRPDDRRHEVVIFAGLSAEATWRCVQSSGDRHGRSGEILLLPAHASPRHLTIGEPTAASAKSAALAP